MTPNLIRRYHFEAAEIPLVERLLATGPGAPSLEEKFHIAESIRARSPQSGEKLDRLLLDEIQHVAHGLQTARDGQQKLKQMLDELTAPPWALAVFLRHVDTVEGARALVAWGQNRRLVTLADGLTATDFQAGEEVFLGRELNVIMAPSSMGMPRCGETATFDHYLDDGRLLLKLEGSEELIVDAAGPLKDVKLSEGDMVRIDRQIGMAYERIERPVSRRFVLDEVPNLPLDQIGGQKIALEKLLGSLTIMLRAPERARLYGLDGKRTVLLVGPPGCGKTLMARVAVSELNRLSDRRCAFGVVKPAEWEDQYVGNTQRNIRECFHSVRQSTRNGYAAMFLDEIEAVGRIRGGFAGHHNDKFLAALLAELDGFAEREGIAIIAATNRKDLVDPALLERLSDVEIAVNRPDMRAARAIFEIHLPETIPFSPNGSQATATRRDLIELAVSRLYSPNAENEISRLRFRDGKTRTVFARELASGRLFAQICRAAKQAALLRECCGEEWGLRTNDVEDAVSEAIARLATTLTPANIRAYLSDLPQDVDVVSVEPIVRRVARPHVYLTSRIAS